jgi:hypothetical protein
VCEIAIQQEHHRFYSATILDGLKRRNFQFLSDPKRAVRDAIYELKQQGKVKTVEVGKGGKPHLYELQK